MSISSDRVFTLLGEETHPEPAWRSHKGLEPWTCCLSQASPQIFPWLHAGYNFAAPRPCMPVHAGLRLFKIRSPTIFVHACEPAGTVLNPFERQRRPEPALVDLGVPRSSRGGGTIDIRSGKIRSGLSASVAAQCNAGGQRQGERLHAPDPMLQ